jgi:hypothetical protein
MDITKVNAIRQAVEMFPKTKFVAALDDSKILIEHADSKSQYVVSVTISEDAYIFDSEKAECIAEPKSAEKEFQQNCKSLSESIRNIFKSDKLEESVKQLRQTIQTLPYVEADKLFKQTSEEKKAASEFNPELEKLFGAKLNKYNEERQNFETIFSIFEQDGTIRKGQFIDLTTLKTALLYQSKAYNNFLEGAKQFSSIKQSLQEVLTKPELVDKFFEGFEVKKDVKTSVTAKLVKISHEMNEDLNIKELVPKVSAILENQYVGIAGKPAPVVYNLATDNKFKVPQFFKFQMGVYSPNDVKAMINEMDFYISCYGELNEESMKDLYESKMILEYMYHSNQINDHIIDEMIRTFNKKYAKDNSTAYNDPTKRLAWANREEQKVGSKVGYA